MSRWPEDRGCGWVERSLDAWLDRELDATTTSQIRSHLDRCPRCAAQARLAAEIRQELGALPELDAPRPIVDSILARTSRTPERHHPWSGLFGALARPAWVAVAVALLILGIGLILVRSPSTPPLDPNAAAVAQATAEARFALAKAGLLTRRAGQVVRDRAFRDQIILPAQRGLNRSLRTSHANAQELASEGVDDV